MKIKTCLQFKVSRVNVLGAVGLICTVLGVLGGISLSIAAEPADIPASCKPACNLWDRPACELAWADHVSAVFLGLVIDVKEEGVPIVLNGKQEETLKQTALIRVEEKYLGVEDETVTVTSGGDLCGFSFEKGKRYVIFGKREGDKKFSVSLCGGTKKVSEASDDLKYLRSIGALPNAGTIFGQVWIYEVPPRHYNQKSIRAFRPWIGNVTIKSKSQTFSTATGQDGQFKMDGLPPGTYTVAINSAELTKIETVTVRVKTQEGFTEGVIADARIGVTIHAKGCAKIDFTVDPFSTN